MTFKHYACGGLLASSRGKSQQHCLVSRLKAVLAFAVITLYSSFAFAEKHTTKKKKSTTIYIMHLALERDAKQIVSFIGAACRCSAEAVPLMKANALYWSENKCKIQYCRDLPLLKLFLG